MIQEKITYFETPGPTNTADALKLAVEAARQYGIEDIVIATTGGNTAKMMADEIEHEGLHITIVAYAYGQKEPGTNPMPKELRRHLMDKGFDVISAAHALSGVERSMSTTFGGVYPTEIIAHTLRMFSQGTKVCVEVSAMACDAGCVVGGKPIVAVAGTGSGADTVLVLRPEVSSKLLKTKIDRIVCKPIIK